MCGCVAEIKERGYIIHDDPMRACLVYAEEGVFHGLGEIQSLVHLEDHSSSVEGVVGEGSIYGDNVSHGGV